MLTEIAKLEAVRAVDLPTTLFTDISPKVVAAWRARAAVESPSHLRRHAQPVRLVLLAALLYQRQREITDTLVELLNSCIHKINARAEKKVTEEFVRQYKRIRNKDAMLHRVAEVSLESPAGTGPRRDLPGDGRRGRPDRPACASTGPAAPTSGTSGGCSSPPTPTTTAPG